MNSKDVASLLDDYGLLQNVFVVPATYFLLRLWAAFFDKILGAFEL